MNPFLELSPEVKEAFENNKPVVALESTIIAHGMPYPQNVQTALQVEEVIRAGGAVPATIAIMDGKCKVGLTKSEIERIAKEDDVQKVSRRDFAYIVSSKKMGATTVASTMMIAEMAGIKVFVTGGIGGVHRNGENTMDISADLEELANTNVSVVCAGAKAILDLGKTLEYLETKGVPVLGYQTKSLPAFYSSESEFNVDYKMDSPLDIATFIYTKDALHLKGGVLVTNPIPKEFEYDRHQMEMMIDVALQEVERLGITGKEVSPFLLSKIKELTGGESLDANIQLVLNNARLGAAIASKYQELI